MHIDPNAFLSVLSVGGCGLSAPFFYESWKNGVIQGLELSIALLGPRISMMVMIYNTMTYPARSGWHPLLFNLSCLILVPASVFLGVLGPFLDVLGWSRFAGWPTMALSLLSPLLAYSWYRIYEWMYRERILELAKSPF